MAAQEHSPETRNPEPLRKLAHPIGLSKRLTIGATLSFVNRIADGFPPVGVSLLAIAVYQLAIAQLTHRYREQAHSYRELWGLWDLNT
jgi:hypothetical protein